MGYDYHCYRPPRHRAGETRYVAVRHTRAAAEQGRYHIRFGDPLPNVAVPTAISLPLVSRN